MADVPKMNTENPYFLSAFKPEIWEALGNNVPLPNLGAMVSRPITQADIYHQLQQFATLIIFNANNLDAPGEKIPLKLEGASSHFHIYDMGSCLVATPKDLYSHKRTLKDALQTAEVMSEEAHKRGWAVEFAGFDKMARASFVKFQVLAEKTGRKTDILHYTVQPNDLRILNLVLKSPTQGLSFKND